MAPTPSPVPVSSGRRFRRLRHQALSFSHHPPDRSSASRIESKPRDPDTLSLPSVALEGPPPSPVPSAPSGLVTPASGPSAIPVGPGSDQSGDVPGNIVAAVVVIVLIVGGLIGLVIGGEMLRRQAKTRSEGVQISPLPSRNCFRRRKSKPIKHSVGSQHTKVDREESPSGKTTLTSLNHPPPIFSRNRQRRLSDVWLIRNLSFYNRQPRPEQANLKPQVSTLAARPQTTWSEFSPVTLHVPPPRRVLDRIPEEGEEDCQSQMNSDFEVMLGVAFERSSEPDVVGLGLQADPSRYTLLDGFWEPESLETKERQNPPDCQITGDEDSKSLGSSAPDMTSDGDESSRSSMASLESLGDVNDRESLREEVFELRRAQTRSMQMNKGVLLSLSLKNLDDQNPESTHEEFGRDPSPAPSTPVGEIAKDDEMSLAILGGSFSAVSLTEFPSPPSILPMIPSLVSGF